MTDSAQSPADDATPVEPSPAPSRWRVARRLALRALLAAAALLAFTLSDPEVRADLELWELALFGGMLGAVTACLTAPMGLVEVLAERHPDRRPSPLAWSLAWLATAAFIPLLSLQGAYLIGMLQSGGSPAVALQWVSDALRAEWFPQVAVFGLVVPLLFYAAAGLRLRSFSRGGRTALVLLTFPMGLALWGLYEVADRLDRALGPRA